MNPPFDWERDIDVDPSIQFPAGSFFHGLHRVAWPEAFLPGLSTIRSLGLLPGIDTGEPIVFTGAAFGFMAGISDIICERLVIHR